MARKGRVELLRGAHVLLREMDEDDAQLVVAWRNGPESRKWLIQWDLLTVDVHLEWFRKAKRRGELLIMFDALDGEPVGATSTTLRGTRRPAMTTLRELPWTLINRSRGSRARRGSMDRGVRRGEAQAAVLSAAEGPGA